MYKTNELVLCSSPPTPNPLTLGNPLRLFPHKIKIKVSCKTDVFTFPTPLADSIPWHLTNHIMFLLMLPH